MSADRLSHVSSPRSTFAALPAALLRSLVTRAARLRPGARQSKRGTLVARKRELFSEEFGRVVYYSNAYAHVSLGERPLLLLHGMHLGAGAADFARLFDTLGSRRHTFAPDLPGFGESDSGRDRYDPTLYVALVKQMIELCAGDALLPVDLVAVGLTSEYAASAAAALPDMVGSLCLIDPTGFASPREESALERMARRGSTLLAFSMLERLGLARLCRGGFASVLSGDAYLRGNPQAVYTRVHCPTLVLHAREKRTRFGALARFVRWREHYQAAELPSTRLGDWRAVQALTGTLLSFFAARLPEETTLAQTAS
jgi:pimeloyl-ACP methyl ester carboxylesterase